MALAALTDAATGHSGPPGRLASGNLVLDLALGGGVPRGALFLLKGEVGAGAPEFAFALLRRAAQAGGRAVFASFLRSPGRVRKEAQDLLQEAEPDIEILSPPEGTQPGLVPLAERLGPLDVLVLESASAIGRAESPTGLDDALRALGEEAFSRGLLVLLLHAPGALPCVAEARLEERCDAVLSFSWRTGGPTRRRLLAVEKVRGLAPVLDGEEIPVFELGLHQGAGFSLSHTKSVV